MSSIAIVDATFRTSKKSFFTILFNHAQHRMNCGELIAAHSGGDAESNAVKENDMPEE